MISIVGCDHAHQRKAQSCWGQGVEAFEREQKRQILKLCMLRWILMPVGNLFSQMGSHDFV